MKEEWKDVKGFEGRFKISNHGRLISINGRCKGEKVLNPSIDITGYYQTNLRNVNINKRYRIHRLVAEAFIPNPENKETVNHKDGNKLNNHISNLEWLSIGDNSRHAFNNLYDFKGENHHNSKLTDEDVLKIRLSYQMGLTQKEIATIYGICRRQAGDIIMGVNWKHLPILDYSNRLIRKFKRNRKSKNPIS